MVRARKFQNLIIAWMLAAALSGCGWKKLLGENPPPNKIISEQDANSSSSQDCGDWTKIYAGTEEESATTFECWAAKEPDIWRRIRSARRDEINEREINLIIRQGVLSPNGNSTEAEREALARRLMAVKNLLGFGPTLTRQQVKHWIDWLRTHRAGIRRAYERIFPIGKTHSFTYAELQTSATTIASLLRELQWNKSSAELAALTQDALAIKDKETIAGLEPGIRVLRNLLGFVCPLQGDASHLVPTDLATCFEKMSEHFSPSARWIEFMINDKSTMLETEAADIEKSIKISAALVEKWFSQPEMNPLDTKLWWSWAKTMGANPPENLIESLKMIRRLNTRSNENYIYPTEMNRVFSLIEDYEGQVLDAIPHFSRAFQSKSCLNQNATTWKDCALKDLSVREKSKTIDMLLRVRNPRHGLEAVPINGSEMSNVAFFDAVAGQLIDIFDVDHDGVISVDLGLSEDELVSFITGSIETYQAVDHYVSNLSKKLEGGITGNRDGDQIQFSRWNMAGFAKLVASSHDVLVERTPAQRNILDKVLSLISNSFPRGALFVDRPAITAMLTTLTSLPHYRETALKEFLGGDDAAKAAMNDNKPFSREVFRSHIGDMLRRNFPRTYESCMRFGFDISCEIAFDEVMTSPDPERNLITPSDIDLVTLMAIGMEGVFDSCGKNKDGKLSASIFDGKDDLDCGFTRMKDVAIHLLDSHIVQIAPGTQKLAESMLEMINAVFVTRTVGKVALVRGTKGGALFNLPLFWAFGKTATIGSSYALLSDVVASDRVKQAKSKAR